MGQYERHAFVCVFGKTCMKQGAEESFDVLKDAVKEAGLKNSVRVNRAGCMGQCGHGPMVVVYPENVWYGGVGRWMAHRIAQEHLVRGHVVDGARYLAQPGDNKRD